MLAIVILRHQEKLSPDQQKKRGGKLLEMSPLGAPGWRSRLSVRLQPGHDLAVHEFEPRVRLWADGSEPGACFRFCVSLSLCPSPVHALSLSVSKINKNVKKKFRNVPTKGIVMIVLLHWYSQVPMASCEGSILSRMAD